MPSSTIPMPIDFGGVRINARARSADQRLIRISRPQIAKILRQGAVLIRCDGSYSDDFARDAEFGYHKTRFRPVRQDILRGETPGDLEDLEARYVNAHTTYYCRQSAQIHLHCGTGTSYSIAPADQVPAAEIASLAEQRAGPTKARAERHTRLRPRLERLIKGKPAAKIGPLRIAHLHLPPDAPGDVTVEETDDRGRRGRLLMAQLPPAVELDEDSLTKALLAAKVIREEPDDGLEIGRAHV